MNINEKICEVKERIRLLTKGFPYNDYQINLFTICYMAISSIDNDITDILDEVFSRTFILFNDGSYDEMLRKHYPELDVNTDNYVPRTFDEDSLNNDDFIVMRFPHGDLYDFMDALLHEIKHAVNSVVNASSKMAPGEGLISYCGLSSIDYNGDYFVTLDEVFNSFIVKVYLDQIMALKKMDINVSGISEILDEIREPKHYNYAYHRELRNFLSLFNDIEIFTLFYNAVLYRDFEPLEVRLEEIFMEDPEYLFGDLLERSGKKGLKELEMYFDAAKFVGNYDLELKGNFKGI